MTVLMEAGRMDFADLRRLSGLSKSNVSKQIRRLEDAGLIEVERRFEGRTLAATATITEVGADAIGWQWLRIESVCEEARRLDVGGGDR